MAITLELKRKIINIPEDVFRYLSVKAAANGTNLKKYIEGLLIKDAEAMGDNETYRQLVEKDPERLVPANEQEQKEFREWLNI